MNKEKGKNKKGIILIISGIILTIISLSINIYNGYLEYNAGKKSNDVLNTLKENLSNNLDNQELIQYEENNIEMKTINIDGYNYIGSIIIPKLNLELPIMDQYDYERLNIAPCLYYGSIYTNDLIICAHSYKTHFGYLSNLEQGDNIIISLVDGNSYIYEVLEIEILASTDVSKMIDNDFDLTLYTCTSDGMNRITIRCNKINKTI